jgi:hypothetical protein
MGKMWGLKQQTRNLISISGRGDYVIIQKLNALMELQKLALGMPTKISPQTIALYVLSSMAWVTENGDSQGDVPQLEKLFKVTDPGH